MDPTAITAGCRRSGLQWLPEHGFGVATEVDVADDLPAVVRAAAGDLALFGCCS